VRNTSASSRVPTKCGEIFSDFIAAATESAGGVGDDGDDGDDDERDSAVPTCEAAPVRGASEAEEDKVDTEPDDEEEAEAVCEVEAGKEAWARNDRMNSSMSRYLDTDPCDATRASAIFQKAVSSEVALSAAAEEEEEEEAGNLTF
jgi:hypothetical protein